jgi:hypothetical protein
MTLKELLQMAQGATGKAIDTVGRALGNPLPDFHLSENAEAAGAGAIPTAQRVTQVQNDPRFGTAPASSTNTYYPNVSQVPDQPSYVGKVSSMTSTPDAGGANPGVSAPAGGTGAPTGDAGTGTGDTLQSLYERQLLAARDEARRQAQVGFDRARGIYDEGVGLLDKRKGEFQTNFDTGRENILNGFEQGRGELQASNTGAETRMANAMRALGLGGSAYVKNEGANRQNAAKALGGLQTERNTNEVANKGVFDTNQDWANTQQSSLDRYLGDAANARTGAETSSDLGYLSDMGNLFNTILSNQLAVKAAAGNYTADPYSVNISDMTKSLNGTLPSLSGGTGTVQDVNLKEQDPTLALLKKRSGIAGAGLYA